MKHVNKAAKAVLDEITAGLGPGNGEGDSRKIDNTPGFMPLHVQWMSGDVFNVAHYFKQEGDLMSDPAMDFWHGPDGEWYPCSIEQSPVGHYQQSVEFEDGKPARIAVTAQRDHAAFANMWMKNVRAQQGPELVREHGEAVAS